MLVRMGWGLSVSGMCIDRIVWLSPVHMILCIKQVCRGMRSLTDRTRKRIPGAYRTCT